MIGRVPQRGHLRAAVVAAIGLGVALEALMPGMHRSWGGLLAERRAQAVPFHGTAHLQPFDPQKLPEAVKRTRRPIGVPKGCSR